MFRLTAGQPLADGVREVAASQLDDALATIDDSALSLHERIHEARKRCRKVRALLRLVRDEVPDTYDRVNTELRDTARLVSDERDAAAFVEAHDALGEALGTHPTDPTDPTGHTGPLEPYVLVREQLVAHRDGEVLARIEERLPEVRERLATVRWNVGGWELPDGDALACLAAGYARTYGRARKRWRQATGDEPTSEVWHEWRKRVKYHRHHVNLLQQAWPPVMDQREELLHDLTDLLGDDHDLAELRTAVRAGPVEVDPDTVTAYVGLLDGARTRLQHRALPLAARLYTQPADEHSDEVFGWWQLAIDEARDAAVDADELTPVIRHGD